MSIIIITILLVCIEIYRYEFVFTSKKATCRLWLSLYIPEFFAAAHFSVEAGSKAILALNGWVPSESTVSELLVDSWEYVIKDND